MKKRIMSAVFASMVLAVLSISASAQIRTHSVWTNLNGYYIIDATNGCQYTSFGGFNMATSWNEPLAAPNPADAHFRGVGKAAGFSLACPTRFYDFRLVASTATTNDQIDGTWDVYRNNILMCSACNGSAYGLSQPAGVGNYYKVYVDDPFFGPQTWGYIGYIDQRKDF
jgi:hypothetical protein